MVRSPRAANLAGGNGFGEERGRKTPCAPTSSDARGTIPFFMHRSFQKSDRPRRPTIEVSMSERF